LVDRLPLRKAYDKAVKDGAETFKYKGMDVLTSYARYVLEYMDGVAKKGRVP
jgi:hypothetical protein